ncbi:MAG: 3-isopropylmalate dehydratase small subunit [bacterium]|nr:3-isopropylmalate dehydratase small subunit [bacterium]
MRKFTELTSHAVAVPVDNIDTDQIIPGRFLTTTSSEGLGRHLFADWRYDGDGSSVEGFPLNQDQHRGAEILVGGHNFGCGSSREHAVWSLTDYGFRAVVSTSFADIFHANALRNGLVAVRLAPEAHQALLAQLQSGSTSRVTVDLEAQQLSWEGGSTNFDFDPFSKHCITRGIDELGYLIEQQPLIETFETRHQPRFNTTGEIQ